MTCCLNLSTVFKMTSSNELHRSLAKYVTKFVAPCRTCHQLMKRLSRFLFYHCSGEACSLFVMGKLNSFFACVIRRRLNSNLRAELRLSWKSSRICIFFIPARHPGYFNLIDYRLSCFFNAFSGLIKTPRPHCFA